MTKRPRKPSSGDSEVGYCKSVPAAGSLCCAWHSRPLARRGGPGFLARRRRGFLVLRDAPTQRLHEIDHAPRCRNVCFLLPHRATGDRFAIGQRLFR
jgi:hypothetical protein